MRNRLALAAALGSIAFVGCGTPTPCSGDNCLQLAGTYLFVLNGQVNCSIWEKNVPPSSVLTITQSGSSITAQLWPDTDDPHEFTGTLYTNDSINIAETQQNQLLGIPYGTITGTFSSTSGAASVDAGGLSVGQPPFYFSGQLFLQGGGMQATSSGGSTQSGGLQCTGSVGMTAEEQGIVSMTDGGTDAGVDAGYDAGGSQGTPDAGPDAGDGG